MDLHPEIPREPLDVRHASTGFLPLVGLHRCGRLFRQESSYSFLCLAGFMLLASTTSCFLPWSGVKYWLAAGLALAGVCTLAGYWLRNRLGQTIILDPGRTVAIIRGGRTERTIPWDAVIAVQICRHEVAGDSEGNGWQLNLAWRDGEGRVQRHCLHKNVVRRYVMTLGRKYAALFNLSCSTMTQTHEET